jgi:glycosyltransferase involved in cell wall biosynthesis
MRVLIACDWHVKYASAQSAALARAGADVLLLSRGHSDEFAGNAVEREHCLDTARLAGVLTIETRAPLRDLTGLAAIRKRIGSFRPDIVHTHSGAADPRAIPLVPKAPTVITVHDPKPRKQPQPSLPRLWLLKAATEAWMRRASAIVVHSERLRAEMELRPHQACFVIPHGLDVRERALAPPRQPSVSFFGRLEPYKGLDVLARAMPSVWNRRPDICLNVAGSGASTLPLSDRRVHLQRGYLPESAIEDFFAASSVAVLPYTEASQTGVGSHAVGYGVPVIASRVGGLPDLTLDETYLVDSGDAAALAEAIVRHIDDDATVRTRVLSEIAMPRSWDAAAAHSLALYGQLVGARTGA